jgi:acetyl-CoA carboxylase biotin carboxyl carrier protein
MTISEIKELIQVVIESGVAELEVQRGEDRVRIRRNSASPVAQEFVVSGVPPQMAPYQTPNASQSTPVQSGLSSAGATAPEPAIDPKVVTVKSPIVGTYYDAPSPGAAAFAKVGDTVKPGQVLCIIESMKLMNEIEAEVGGVLTAKLVENGSPIEYGEALFTIRQP